MKIALGADSAGKPLLDVIEAHLKAKAGHEVSNLSQSGFYADLSANLAHKVKDGEFERGILAQAAAWSRDADPRPTRGVQDRMSDSRRIDSFHAPKRT